MSGSSVDEHQTIEVGTRDVGRGYGQESSLLKLLKVIGDFKIENVCLDLPL